MEPIGSPGKNPGGPLLKKSELLTGLLVFCSLLSATSCSSSAIKSDEAWKTVVDAGPKTSPLHTDPQLWKKAVTQVGQNSSASFSPDGRHILFVSRERLNHRQGQLYEMDLVAKTEKRLSFQDGDVTEAVYSPDGGRIFYASTTDEIKERPRLLYPEADQAPFPRTEIYSILQDEDLHERWTENPGFDGFLQVHDEGNRRGSLTISRYRNGELQLYRSGLQKPAFEMVLGRPGTWLHSFSAHPREGVRAWIEEDPKSHNSKVSISGRGRGVQSVITKFFEARNLHLWSSKDVRGLSSTTPAQDMDDLGLLLTAKLRADGPRQAFWVLPSKNCYQTLDLGPGEIQSLDLSSDQKMILWTLKQSSNSQVFVDEFIQPERLCEAL